MRILYVHSSADLYGSDRSLLKILKYRDKEKIVPIVCIPCAGPLVEELKKLGVPSYVFDAGVIRRMHLSPIGLIRVGFLTFIGVIRILSIIKKENIDIVHTNTSVVIAGAVAAKIAGVKHVWHVREIYSFRGMAGKIYAALIDFFSDAVICVSRAAKENLTGMRKKIEKKTAVIHNGVDPKDYSGKTDKAALVKKYGLPEGKIFFGMAGRINRVKGYEYALEAAAKIKAVFPRAHFLIAGDVFSRKEDWRKKKLDEDIGRLGLRNDVTLLGFVKEIEEIFNLMDIYLFTSVQPDSFPATILEAMASGKPVVANDAGGGGEIVIDGQTGFLVRTLDIDSFCAAALRLAKDGELRREMGEAGKERCVKEFSVEESVRKIEEVYAAVKK